MLFSQRRDPRSNHQLRNEFLRGLRHLLRPRLHGEAEGRLCCRRRRKRYLIETFLLAVEFSLIKPLTRIRKLWDVNTVINLSDASVDAVVNSRSRPGLRRLPGRPHDDASRSALVHSLLHHDDDAWSQLRGGWLVVHDARFFNHLVHTFSKQCGKHYVPF